MNPYNVIERPRLTEKTVHLQNKLNTYTFKVHPQANKIQIREAIQEIFKVKVSAVRTMNCRGKQRRTRLGTGTTASWKKAYVTLAEGEFIEGV
ncbi:MAG: 50S ribosomal protein L23 [Planctomycetota bacterium]|nr:MAG: 50S ribosomal protein L23 [Planctomycetota bacterium]